MPIGDDVDVSVLASTVCAYLSSYHDLYVEQ
jgi:hypothetical protein